MIDYGWFVIALVMFAILSGFALGYARFAWKRRQRQDLLCRREMMRRLEGL